MLPLAQSTVDWFPISGSHKLEEDFEELEPEEAKYRLGLLVKKMDKNEDNSVSKEELIDWILLGFRYGCTVKVLKFRTPFSSVRK